MNRYKSGNVFYAMQFLSETSGWVAGDAGRIFRTTDDGVTWEQEPGPTSSELFDMIFVSENQGWIVGRWGVILGTV